MIYATWQGGPNYARDDDRRELFTSVRKAGDALVDREDNGHWLPMTFVYAELTDRALVPCVQDSTMFLYRSAQSQEAFALLERGPRGGVKRTNL